MICNNDELKEKLYKFLDENKIEIEEKEKEDE